MKDREVVEATRGKAASDIDTKKISAKYEKKVQM